jgi:hypothetical protein
LEPEVEVKSSELPHRDLESRCSLLIGAYTKPKTILTELSRNLETQAPLIGDHLNGDSQKTTDIDPLRGRIKSDRDQAGAHSKEDRTHTDKLSEKSQNNRKLQSQPGSHPVASQRSARSAELSDAQPTIVDFQSSKLLF